VQRTPDTHSKNNGGNSSTAKGVSGSHSRSRSGSTSASDSRSRSGSTSASDSRSRSDSTSGSDSRSRSDSTSGSDSRSRSDSTSASDSRSRSDSTSASDSRSRSDSTSASDSRSQSDSLNTTQSTSESGGETETFSEQQQTGSSQGATAGVTINQTIQKVPLGPTNEIEYNLARVDDPSDFDYPGLMLVKIKGRQYPFFVRRCNYFQDDYFTGLYDPHWDHEPPPELHQFHEIALPDRADLKPLRTDREPTVQWLKTRGDRITPKEAFAQLTPVKVPKVWKDKPYGVPYLLLRSPVSGILVKEPISKDRIASVIYNRRLAYLAGESVSDVSDDLSSLLRGLEIDRQAERQRVREQEEAERRLEEAKRRAEEEKRRLEEKTRRLEEAKRQRAREQEEAERQRAREQEEAERQRAREQEEALLKEQRELNEQFNNFVTDHREHYKSSSPRLSLGGLLILTVIIASPFMLPWPFGLIILGVLLLIFCVKLGDNTLSEISPSGLWREISRCPAKRDLLSLGLQKSARILAFSLAYPRICKAWRKLTKLLNASP
jgi:hypothetical protein